MPHQGYSLKDEIRKGNCNETFGVEVRKRNNSVGRYVSPVLADISLSLIYAFSSLSRAQNRIKNRQKIQSSKRSFFYIKRLNKLEQVILGLQVFMFSPRIFFSFPFSNILSQASPD